MALIDKLNVVDRKYYNPQFIRLIIDHTDHLLQSSRLSILENHIRTKYQNNFYGLCNELKIPPKYRLVTQLINNIDNVKDIQHVRALNVPNFEEVESLLKTLTITERNIL